MSVPVNERTHGKLEACTKAFELVTYTLRITRNKKVFTEEFQECLTDKIISAALDIYMFTGSANELQVRSPEDYENYIQRIRLQKHAAGRCGDLNRLILLAKPIFHLATKRVKYWAGLTRDTKALIKAWSESDRKRFMPLFENKRV